MESAKHLGSAKTLLSTLESAKHLERVLSTLESAKYLKSSKHLGEC